MSRVEVLAGGELLIRDPATVRVLLRLVDTATRTNRRDGIRMPAYLRELREAAVVAVERQDGMSAYRQATAPAPLLPVSTRYLTTPEAAAMLGVTERAVRAQCQTGAMDAIRRKNGWRIPVEEVLDRKQRQKEQAA